MANATAAQAYTAVRALETEQTTADGYCNSIRVQVVLDKIIADNAGVTTQAEALAGIHAAVGENVHQNIGYLDSGVATDKLYMDANAYFVWSGIDG